MGEANNAKIDDIRHSLNLIRSTRPEDRTRGIAILSQMRSDPRVVQVFQLLYRDDPDPRVRAAAWNALNPLGMSDSLPATVSQPDSARQRETALERSAEARPESQGLFLANPENARVVARYTRQSRQSRRGGRIIRVMVGLALLLAGIFWGLVLPEWWRLYQLRADGVTTQAVVTSLQERGNGRHVVTYRFAAGSPEDEDAPAYSGEWRATLGEFLRLEEDDLIPVVYLPSDPSVSRLELRSPDNTRRLRRSLAALALSLFAAFLLLYDIRRRRAARLNRLLRGEVLTCSGHMDQEGNYHIKLRYRFSTPGGQPISGQVTRTRNDLRNGRLPKTGTPVAVFYKGQRSYRIL